MPARSLEELQKQYSGAQGGAPSNNMPAGGPRGGGPGQAEKYKACSETLDVLCKYIQV